MQAASTKHALDDNVVNHMRTDSPRLHVDQTVGQSLQSIRDNPPESRIVYFYVVDDQDRLKGVIPTRRLLLSGPDRPLKEIMIAEVITISSHATVLDACEYFILHRLLAFPVVDEGFRLVGVIDIELYTEELSDLDRREGSDELFQLIGVHLDALKQNSLRAAFANRFPWLLANVAGGLMAAFLTGAFELELQKAVALALFIPVVLALAESVSIQSVSLALRVLAGRKPKFIEILRKLRYELVTGFSLGMASGLVVAAVALLWLGQWPVALCILGGIAGSVTCASAIGMMMPNMVRLFNREPQVAAGPIALACTDMVTLLIYFLLARLLLA